MDIEEFLKSAGVKFQKYEHAAAYTAQEIAAEVHVSGDAVAKPVVVRADKQDVLCVLPASHKIDMGKLAKALKVKKCQLVNEDEVAKLFPDVEVGAEPPFGKPYGLPTVVDSHLADCEFVVFSAGSHRRAIRMRYDDYARLAESTVADFSIHL
jgi:Ala-tRNA(Pro) deacylase